MLRKILLCCFRLVFFFSFALMSYVFRYLQAPDFCEDFHPQDKEKSQMAPFFASFSRHHTFTDIPM